MRLKLKWVTIIEAIVILVLLAIVLNSHVQKTKISKQMETGLLSPRIYTGLLEPESHLIINFAPLKTSLDQFIAENNLNVSVYVENLRNGAYMGINEKTGFFPASLNKLPVAILIIEKIENGELSFDTELEIKDSDRMDSSGSLYETKEKKLPLKMVLEKLIKESDNTAFSVLLHQLSADDFQFLVDYYGMDMNAYGSTDDQLINPKSVSNLFISLYFSTVLEPQNSEYLLSLMTNTTFDIKKVAKLPDDVSVAHKYGVNYYNNSKFFHDCGIMYINESRIFYCVMTKNLDAKDALEVIGSITHETYTYVVTTKSNYEAFKNN